MMCTIPAIHMYSLLPSLSSLYSHSSISHLCSLPSNKHTVHIILFHTHWLMSRCFIYKIPPACRPSVFEFIWTSSQVFKFRWLASPLSQDKDSKYSMDSAVPEKEAVFTNYKLIYLMMKMATIEVRVQLDYLYKDVVSVYESSMFFIALFIMSR